MDTPIRRCTKCAKDFPATREFFYASRHNTIGLEPRCKTCNSRDDGHKPRERLPDNQLRCTHCRNIYPASDVWFYRNRQSKSGFVGMCKSCWSADQRRKRIDNPDRFRKTEQKYRDNHREKRRASGILYNAKHKQSVKRYAERYSREHREETKARSQKHYVENKASYRQKWQRRRQAKLNLPFNWSDENWRVALIYFEDRCAYCGNQQGLFPETRLTQDHFIPIASAKCPGTVPENIVPACATCNKSKSKQDAAKWLRAKFSKKRMNAILLRIEQYFAWLRESDTQ